jgi:hypothetical protein
MLAARREVRTMSDNKLVLHPRDALYAPPDAEALTRWLQDVGLARDMTRTTEVEAPTGERRTFRAGRAFEELVVFGAEERARAVLRHVSEGPQSIDRAQFLREIATIVLVGPLEREWFLASGTTIDPACPSCGANADWNEIAGQWYASWEQGPSTRCPDIPCAACGRRGLPWTFDWRRGAGFARIYLELWHLHRGEAVPSEAFMRGLEEITGTPWTWLFYRL